jgi:predicted ferric reductase
MATHLSGYNLLNLNYRTLKMAGANIKIKQYGNHARLLWGVCLTAVVAMFLIGAICVPFLFESQTLRYQFGMDRNFLLTGHVMGIAAGALLLVQLVLISRLKFLDRVFSINRLLLLHRINAVIILLLAALHLVLVLNILGREILAFEIRQWPAFIGLLLLVMLAGIVLSGLFRGFIRIKYQFWIFFHRIFTPVTILILSVHVYFVSDTFHYDNARVLILSFYSASFIMYMILRIRRLRLFRYSYRVESVQTQAAGINTVELVPEIARVLTYAPGQFAFLKVISSEISAEEHPFTISSSPTRATGIQFTIKESGDWTEKVKEIKTGNRVYIDGPFGIFGHLDFESMDEVIMIAGGIGITPLLSILRYLHDIKSGKKITLLWSNRTQKEVVYANEFRTMAEKMPNLTIKYLFTREKGIDSAGRLDMDGLERLLATHSRKSTVLLCGPPAMMTQVRMDLISIGFKDNSIITERFNL